MEETDSERCKGRYEKSDEINQKEKKEEGKQQAEKRETKNDERRNNRKKSKRQRKNENAQKRNFDSTENNCQRKMEVEECSLQHLSKITVE